MTPAERKRLRRHYFYLRHEDGWMVGSWDRHHRWHSEGFHEDREEASARAARLNEETWGRPSYPELFTGAAAK